MHANCINTHNEPLFDIMFIAQSISGRLQAWFSWRTIVVLIAAAFTVAVLFVVLSTVVGDGKAPFSWRRLSTFP